jgi:peptidoglycan hydrolase-like protein with peptidoglycan-binding domain
VRERAIRQNAAWDDGANGGGRWRAFVPRALVRRPKESLAMLLAIATAGTILVNALFLQSGRHPAPIFSTRPLPVAAADSTGTALPVLPRPRPVELDAKPEAPAATPRPRAEIISGIQRELARRGFYDGAVDGVYGARTDAAIRDFEQSAGSKTGGEPSEGLLQAITRAPVKAATVNARPAAALASPVRHDPIAELIGPSKRVLAVQRALADFGYGQIQPTGVVNPETEAAIQKFERERKLPVTGQVSERLSRELAAMSGRPLE